MVNIRSKGKIHLLIVGVQIPAVAMGTNMVIPQEAELDQSQNPVTPLFGLYPKHFLFF